MLQQREIIHKDRLTGRFMELVRIDSESRHEREISEHLKKQFDALGLRGFEDNTMAATGHGSGNLFFAWEASPGWEHAETLFFTSHMDTVTPGKGIQPRLDDDGYFRSNGETILGSDDKAGIAAMLEAICAMTERGMPHGKIQFVITVGEEKGLVGSRAIDPQHIEAAYGYALDSNGRVGGICVAAPSQSKIQVILRGKSAHAGVNPESGISAIQVASKAVSRMPLGRIDKETTANIGRFEGGGETNIVCDQVTISAEARSLDKEKLDRQIEAMRLAFESAAAEFGAQVDFQSNIIYPSYRFDDQAPVVRRAMQAMRRLGHAPFTFQSGGGSDANVFNGLGIPTVNLAVGYEHIHTTREQLKLGDLVGLSEIVVAIIREASS